MRRSARALFVSQRCRSPPCYGRGLSETRGFIKGLVEARGKRSLGFAMIGAEAGEVAAVVQTAMLAGMPYTGLRDAIVTHPTMAEGLVALFSNIAAP